MRNTITLNGVESSTIPGLLIQELPAISKPLMRTEVETIDGRDGDITTGLGFSAYDKQISIGLFADYDIDQIIAYFNSKGTVIFSNEPDKFYNYEIVDQIDFERLVRYRTATVTMHCQPFKYSTTEGADILSTNSNFATLNQSLNTDTGFYTYSSNVQDDVTATRSSGTGGKFFAVFTVPVVQGVTYYFSGNVSKNVFMYGYTNQLRGTSAGISGKGFNGYFTYTATFTGTMVLGFYSNATTEIFIRNFKVSNQSTSTVSGEGTNIVLENSAEAPFSRFDLKGNLEQDGTPTPDSPLPVKVVAGKQSVIIHGKNLFNNNKSAALNVSAVASAINTGIRITTTSGSAWSGCIFVIDKLSNFADKTIRLSTKASPSGANTAYAAIISCDARGNNRTTIINAERNDIKISTTIESEPDASKYLGLVINASGGTAGGTGSYVDYENFMLTAGDSSFQDYEPYREQSYDIDLDNNLFDKNNPQEAYVYVNPATTTLQPWTQQYVSCYVPIQPNTTYTVEKAINQNNNRFAIATTKELPAAGVQTTTAIQDNEATSLTITSGAEDNYLVIYFKQGSDSTNNAQIYKTITVTNDSDTRLYLAKIGDYQDYIYKNGNKWYLHRVIGKMATTGDEVISLSNVMINIGNTEAVQGQGSIVYCTHAVYKWQTVNGACYVSGTGTNVCIGVSGLSTNTDAKNWITNNKPIFYYRLREPQDIEITNDLLKAQLEAIDQANAYRVRTHIDATALASDNAPHIIAAEVTTDPSGTITNSGNIYSKPKLTIFGSGNVGVYLNGVQMFQIALGTNDYITIDTAIMEAYKDNLQTLKNRSVTGDYNNFKLPVGESEISFSGNVTMCVVENYSRWL